jgi:hypothetical protein
MQWAATVLGTVAAHCISGKMIAASDAARRGKHIGRLAVGQPNRAQP